MAVRQHPRSNDGKWTRRGVKSQLTSLRADVDRAVEELRRALPPHQLFRLGAPNDAARARLATVLAPILAGDAGTPPEHTWHNVHGKPFRWSYRPKSWSRNRGKSSAERN
jgi:hypothetical protein